MQPGPYGAPPAAPVGVEPLKPSGWWYVAAVGVGIAGIVGAIVIAVVSFNRFIDHIDDFARVDAPGTDTVRLEEGEYTVFLEFPGADEEFVDEPFVDFTITDPDGTEVDLDDYFGESTYSADSRDGLALYTFTADETGEYTVTSEGDPATIAIGEGLFGGALGGFIGAAILGFVAVVAAIIMIIVIAVKRSGARNRRQLALVRSGWTQSGPPGWPGPPGASAPPGAAGPPGYSSGGPPPGSPPSDPSYPPAPPPSSYPPPPGPFDPQR
jgi:hypothetical protein